MFSPDLNLTEKRIKELEQPVTDEQFTWLEQHGRLDNGKTYGENRTEVEAEDRTRTGNTPTCEDCDQPIDRCTCEEIETEFAGMTDDTVKLISELDGDNRRREMARIELQRRSNEDIDDSQDKAFDDEFSGDRDDEVGTPH